ncbi:class I adenylate-forming enzyme family protein [Actinomadura sp. BRA 177]|uniref:class I adenylate-forming enzyme family protein n=1 Tax=Actinomadura sp. BRA 177 TaxID=2745202 RepID=UPI0015959800|nr:AMP-binding protein [Actinomadura sp. BRA 177]NVI92777.1 AMP-binding protein [Actinomadura sp. BRA 177]
MSVPGVSLSIAGGVREFGSAVPETVAVIDGDRRLTYGELHERSSRLANALAAAGLAPGDPVAVLLGNRLEYHEIAAGIAKAGLVMVPLNPRLLPADSAFIMGHSRARAIIYDESLADRVEPLPGGLRTHLTIGAGGSYEQALAEADTEDPQVPADERDPFCIAYTSGTTGEPKGVLISHRSRVLTFYMSALDWRLGPGRTSIAVAPMYHGAGFAFGYAPVFTGGTVVMLPRWAPEGLLALIERHRAQSVFLVPTHAQAVRALGDEALRSHDLSSLDTLFFNAAALPVPLKDWVIESFPGVDVHEVYGSTEAGVITDLRPPDARRKAGSVGHPWFMTEVRLLDDDGAEVPPGTPGELFSRSPFLMNGYLRDPAATEACLSPDGFLTSGDVAVRDEEGYITIVDRKKDLIITGGVNVYPRDVETVLEGCPGVAECAVVGEPDEMWGERIVAYAVAAPGHDLGPEAITEFLGGRLARHKVPKDVRLLPSLPRNAAGKVLKRELRTVLVEE